MMTKKYTKKLSSMILALVLLISIAVSGMAVYASSDNNYSYSFEIVSGDYATRNTTRKYRGTDDNNNAWKVNLRSSEEGEKTITMFSICLNSNRLASSWHNVTQGSGSHYYATNDYADKAYVYLQGKNNNNSTKEYTVSGYWDEETGVKPD